MIYLASPYSHEDADVREYRYVQACKAAAALIRQGGVVFCPIAHSHGIAVHGGIGGEWDIWKEMDEHFLKLCNLMSLVGVCSSLVILTLEGYDRSEGIKAEVKIAQRYHIPIEYMEPVDGIESQGGSDSQGLRRWVQTMADRERPEDQHP